MASYYYLMSSLPMLKSDGEMPFEYSRFLEMCKECVSDSKYAILEKLTVESKNGPLISDWSEFYDVYKKELCYQRNLHLGKPASQPLVRDESIIRVVTSAIGENPLKAELDLLALQFERLDSLIGSHAFDDIALMGYALKLKLLQRKTVFDKKKGQDELNKIVDGLMSITNKQWIGEQ